MNRRLASLSRFGDARRQRIGLLGGSFNPAHAGHRHVAQAARAALGLDVVWLMVSPSNPLKPAQGMAPFADRLASAVAIAAPPRILATDIEARLGHRHTVRTLAALRRRFRRARFVLILGADNLLQLPRWHRWRRLPALAPIAVLPRPGWTRRALASQAAKRLRAQRRPPRRLLLSGGWCLIPAREHPASASAIRAAQAGRAAEEAPLPTPLWPCGGRRAIDDQAAPE
jgi:nicotinate-nucleotide adenylyltransferase